MYRLEDLPEIERENILASRQEEMQKFKEAQQLEAMYRMSGLGSSSAAKKVEEEGDDEEEDMEMDMDIEESDDDDEPSRTRREFQS